MRNLKLSRNEWKSVVHEIFMSAYYTGSTHSEILESLQKRVYDPLNERTESGKRRYSPSDFSYILGYIDAQYEWVWTQVEFAYRDNAGVVYSTHRETQQEHTTEEFYSQGRGIELADMERCHLWKRNSKPFTEWQK